MLYLEKNFSFIPSLQVPCKVIFYQSLLQVGDHDLLDLQKFMILFTYSYH